MITTVLCILKDASVGAVFSVVNVRDSVIKVRDRQ